MSDTEDACAMDNSDSRMGLRIGGIFVILVSVVTEARRQVSMSLMSGHIFARHDVSNYPATIVRRPPTGV